MTRTGHPGVLPALSWSADVLPGFEQSTLQGLSAADGPVELVLVRRRCTAATNASDASNASDATNASNGIDAISTTNASVLYIHGFVDYFFQVHLADFYNAAGLHFYALDLRRHGRSLRPHQLPNCTRDIDEYLQDVDTAMQMLRDVEGVQRVLLNGHSTGGLVAALYAHRGRHRQSVDAVFLNSPFLDMNLPAWQQRWVEPVLSALGRWFPRWRLPGLSTVYGQTVHADHHGEWQYDTAWKPIHGFAVYAGWFRAIHRAHAEVERGLAIDCPCLVLHARHSRRTRVWSDAAMAADIVLDVADIQRLSPRLGPQVEIHAVDGAMHDLVLSAGAARAATFRLLADWLHRIGLGKPRPPGRQPARGSAARARTN